MRKIGLKVLVSASIEVTSANLKYALSTEAINFRNGYAIESGSKLEVET